MKITYNVILLLSLFHVIDSSNSFASDPVEHRWKQICYPHLPCNWASGRASPSLVRGAHGIEFRLTFYDNRLLDDSDGQGEFVNPDPASLYVRLHLPDGSIVEPNEPAETEKLIPLGWVGGLGGSQSTIQRIFPWRSNELNEAWIEVKYPNYIFWLEVPYGFTRDPSADLSPDLLAGPPKLAPSMKRLIDGAKIVPWEYVEYHLGVIGNGRSVTLHQSNLSTMYSDVIIYRDDAEVGKSIHLWKMESTKTGITLGQSQEDTLKGRLTWVSLHPNGRIRKDEFIFDQRVGANVLRDWGKISVRVEETTRELIMPSSMFRYHHGRADYGDKVFIP